MKELYPFIRQMQVIGEARQRELLASRTVVRGRDLGALVEVLYLRGAGVGEVVVEAEEDARDQAPSAAGQEDEITRSALEGFADETAREAARGALRALAYITGHRGGRP